MVYFKVKVSDLKTYDLNEFALFFFLVRFSRYANSEISQTSTVVKHRFYTVAMTTTKNACAALI